MEWSWAGGELGGGGTTGVWEDRAVILLLSALRCEKHRRRNEAFRMLPIPTKLRVRTAKAQERARVAVITLVVKKQDSVGEMC